MMLKYLLSLAVYLAMVNLAFGQVDPRRPVPVLEKHIITSDGVDLYVVVKGAGTPCLYIHGGPGAGSYWMEKFAGDVLERNFKMVYLDQRGAGRSKSPNDGDFSMRRMVNDFEEVRKALGIRQWVIMGHSFGGILQMGYAQQYPEVIKGMVMLNCSLNMPQSLKDAIPRACELLELKETNLYTDERIPVVDRVVKLYEQLRKRDLFWKMGYASKKSSEIMDASFAEVPGWNHDLEKAALQREEYRADFSKVSAEIKVPVLFFFGKTDWLVGPQHYTGVHFPQMILWGSDVGHMACLENKVDMETAIVSYRKKYGF